jgi:hypothetical protein
MRASYVLVFVGTLGLLGSDADAQARHTGVRWDLSVTDALGEHPLVVRQSGGPVDSMLTGLDTCAQAPVRVFQDPDGNLQEEVRVVCELRLSKVTLIESCFVSERDDSFGAMRVDEGVRPFTIALHCATP